MPQSRNRKKPLSQTRPRTVTLISNEIKVAGYDQEAAKRPFKCAILTEEMAIKVGQIAMTWGALECRLNQLIAALGKGVEMPEKWDRRGFNSRKRLCKHLLRDRFPSSEIRDQISAALGKATEAQLKRNVLMHGEIASRLELYDGAPLLGIPPKIDAFITARGEHNGNLVTLDLSTQGVTDVFHEIGHAFGLLAEATNPDGEFEHLPLPHRHLWQDFLAKGLPPLPK